jgi:ribonuclease R
MPLAVYSAENVGHFGLGFPAYAHFTSPIRRYPDLLVHRAIRHLLRKGSVTGFAYSENEMQVHGTHCSMTERRADEATREIVQWHKCQFMQEKVGEIFEGTISSVTSFGVFVELDDIFVEGLVHITALPIDYYHFDPVGHRLRGERSGRVFRLANRVKVKVTRVDVDDKKIDFELIE